jgi:hypothetical protein
MDFFSVRQFHCLYSSHDDACTGTDDRFLRRANHLNALIDLDETHSSPGVSVSRGRRPGQYYARFHDELHRSDQG